MLGQQFHLAELKRQKAEADRRKQQEQEKREQEDRKKHKAYLARQEFREWVALFFGFAGFVLSIISLIWQAPLH